MSLIERDEDAVGGSGGNVSDLSLAFVLLTPIRVDNEVLVCVLFLSKSSNLEAL